MEKNRCSYIFSDCENLNMENITKHVQILYKQLDNTKHLTRKLSSLQYVANSLTQNLNQKIYTLKSKHNTIGYKNEPFCRSKSTKKLIKFKSPINISKTMSRSVTLPNLTTRPIKREFFYSEHHIGTTSTTCFLISFSKDENTSQIMDPPTKIPSEIKSILKTPKKLLKNVGTQIKIRSKIRRRVRKTERKSQNLNLPTFEEIMEEYKCIQENYQQFVRQAAQIDRWIEKIQKKRAESKIQIVTNSWSPHDNQDYALQVYRAMNKNVKKTVEVDVKTMKMYEKVIQNLVKQCQLLNDVSKRFPKKNFRTNRAYEIRRDSVALGLKDKKDTFSDDVSKKSRRSSKSRKSSIKSKNTYDASSRRTANSMYDQSSGSFKDDEYDDLEEFLRKKSLLSKNADAESQKRVCLPPDELFSDESLSIKDAKTDLIQCRCAERKNSESSEFPLCSLRDSLCAIETYLKKLENKLEKIKKLEEEVESSTKSKKCHHYNVHSIAPNPKYNL